MNSPMTKQITYAEIQYTKQKAIMTDYRVEINISVKYLLSLLSILYPQGVIKIVRRGELWVQYVCHTNNILKNTN